MELQIALDRLARFDRAIEIMTAKALAANAARLDGGIAPVYVENGVSIRALKWTSEEVEAILAE